jgi:hypothetical protein
LSKKNPPTLPPSRHVKQSLLHRRVASRLVVVASRRPIPLAPLVVALLRVSSLHRVSSSSHLVLVALPRCVSLSDIERVDGIVHLPFEAVERAVNVVDHFN